MKYQLLKDTIGLLEEFEASNTGLNYPPDVNGFRQWLVQEQIDTASKPEPDWEGKVSGRSAESIIATLFVHMNHYARNYFRSAIHGSEFSTPDEVIFMIVLRFSTPMSKMELIKKNVHDKSAGIQIINRLIAKGWVEQRSSDVDRRSKVISPTVEGLRVLDNLMNKVREASRLVSGPLSQHEKHSLIDLLTKLNEFHLPIYEKNYDPADLLEMVTSDINSN